MKKRPHPLTRCKPRHDFVVVERDVLRRTADGTATTENGLLLPDTFSDPNRQTGTIVSVGPGKLLNNGKRRPMDLKKGDRVIITGYAGLAMVDTLDTGNTTDDRYVLVREEEVLAILPAAAKDDDD